MNTVKVKYCNDDLKYKVFGLFPFLAQDASGKLALFKGNTKSDGCFNQIACNLKITCDLIVDDVTILKKNNSYSYKTLLYYYNTYKDLKDNEFIVLMNEGIGKIEVKPSLPFSFKECDLVPHEVNISECADLYDKMSKLSAIVEYYNARKLIDDKIDCELECLVDKYNRMGGDKLKEYYKEKSLLSDSIADKFYNMADVDSTKYYINICITEQYHDMGSADLYYNYWQEKYTYYKGDIVTYNEQMYICKGKFVGGVDVGVKDDYFNYEYFSTVQQEMCGDIVLKGKSDSKLKSFRKYSNYISVLGKIETPKLGEDWLWFYKKGYLAYYETEKDDDGNIAVSETRQGVIGEYEKHLKAYGDIMLDITYDDDKNTITFKYVIGAHLKAKLAKISHNELKKELFYYSDFEYDPDSTYDGVIYTETYSYDEDGELANIIDKGKFNEFISNNSVSGYEFDKASFDTYKNMAESETEINGTTFNSLSTYSEFTTTVSGTKHFDNYPLIRTDYYDGIAYPIQLKNNVVFGRGNSSAYERHIKLGEVKSFDDLNNYSNGGFFNIIKS